MIVTVLNKAVSTRIFFDIGKHEVRLEAGVMLHAEIDDGTYLRLQKSRDFEVQVATFQRHAPTPPAAPKEVVTPPAPVPKIAAALPVSVLPKRVVAPTSTTLREEIAVIVGGAECWQQDLDAAKKFIGDRKIRYFFINDHIKTFPERGVACTLHPDKLTGQFAWLITRRKAGLPEPEQVWSHRRHPAVTNDTASTEWRGSTGLFAVQIARREGHTRIIGCGIPMTVEGNHFERHQKWQSAIQFRHGWTTHQNDLKSCFRSMSGWTKEIFGAPTEEWLSPPIITSQIIVAVPAWGERCIDHAVRFSIPAVLCALERSTSGRSKKIIVCTDKPDRFIGVLAGMDVEYVKPMGADHVGLKLFHGHVLNQAPSGSLVALLNADIVVSNELFSYGERVLNSHPLKALASVGTRTVLTDSLPPIGVPARELLDWGWRNRHPIVEDLVWGRGKSNLPTMLFFEKGENVVCHVFHTHPFLILKDRELKFRSTIDDDLLSAYHENEICYPQDAEVGFIEISPRELHQQRGFNPGKNVLTPAFMFQFTRNFMQDHIRNFRYPLRIRGTGPVDDDAPVGEILKLLANNPRRRPEPVRRRR